MPKARAAAGRNGAAVAPVAAPEPRENIFLFYPNLIGRRHLPPDEERTKG
jgi:hypothetical protein